MKNLMSLPSLAPGHETQCYRQRKELISLSVFLQFGADRDQICLGRPHLIQVPSHVVNALRSARTSAWRAHKVVHKVTRRRVRLTEVNMGAAQRSACGARVGYRGIDRPAIAGTIGQIRRCAGGVERRIDLLQDGCSQHRLSAVHLIAIVRCNRAHDQRQHGDRADDEDRSCHERLDHRSACLGISNIFTV